VSGKKSYVTNPVHIKTAETIRKAEQQQGNKVAYECGDNRGLVIVKVEKK
jgi:hypothetical protein